MLRWGFDSKGDLALAANQMEARGVCSVLMAKLPGFLKINPLTLNCPRCSAKPGKACDKLHDALEGVHVERIALAAAKDIKAKKG